MLSDDNKERFAKGVEFAKVRIISLISSPSFETIVNSKVLVQTVVHYGWVPLILYVGWSTSNPRPPLVR